MHSNSPAETRPAPDGRAAGEHMKWISMMADVTIRSAIRTLKRLHRLTRVCPESVAKAIPPHVRIDQVTEMMVYLEDVVRAMAKQMQWKCTECGRDLWFNDNALTRKREIQRIRRDAHYCSQACRQKAFRRRVAGRASNTTAQPSRMTDIPRQAAAHPSRYPPRRPRPA
jgi:hypothetical protein